MTISTWYSMSAERLDRSGSTSDQASGPKSCGRRTRKGFFVTTSDGGRNGLYRVMVIRQFRGRLQARDLTETVYKAFGHPVKCEWPESPNVGGIAWIGSEHRVLVAAEIVSHSVCDSYGTFKAYLVDPASMVIVQSYGQIEAKRRFGTLLGTELAAATDECVRDPRSCYLAYNHAHSGAADQ
jgi:hypothetical protein